MAKVGSELIALQRRIAVWSAIVAISAVYSSIPGSGIAQEERELAELEEIPDRFFSLQDSLGYFWQATGNGALASGSVQYLQSGLNLIVDGEEFTPSEASETKPSEGDTVLEVALLESRSGFDIDRSLVFDLERGGVRLLDTFRNRTGVALSLEVGYRTTYPFSWQTLHDLTGEILQREPVLTMPAEEIGMTVHFGPAEGRHDTILLTGPEMPNLPRRLDGSNNQREWTLSYQLELKANETVSLHHWILQRNLSSVDEAASVTLPFHQRGRLLGAYLTAEQRKTVRNYPESALEGSSATPSRLRSLLSLNRLIDQIGVHRRGEEILWLSSSNQLNGTANPEAIITVRTSDVGERTLRAKDLAALRGGASKAAAYLRDGTVYVGEISAADLWFERGEGDGVFREDLEINSVGLLLFRTEATDGVAPNGTGGFLELIDGSVVATAASEAGSISLLTAWGVHSLPWSQVSGFLSVSSPSPHFRVLGEDGSSFRALLTSPELTIKSAAGESILVDRNRIRAFWSEGAVALPKPENELEWLDLSEVDVAAPDQPRFLFSGNQLLFGDFLGEELLLEESSRFVRVPTRDIRSLSRLLESFYEEKPEYEVTLTSGETVRGQIENWSFVELKTGEETVRLPLDLLYGFAREVKP